MKYLALVAAATLTITITIGSSSASAQSSSVRVSPGHFCALNKCVRFSRDLNSVSIQGRRAVSVATYGLRKNPVISAEEFRQIFSLALRQSGVNGNRG